MGLGPWALSMGPKNEHNNDMRRYLVLVLLAAAAAGASAAELDLKKAEEALVRRDALILQGAISDWMGFLKEAPAAAREKYSPELLSIKAETAQAKTMQVFRPLELRFNDWKKVVMAQMFGVTAKAPDSYQLFSQAQVEAYAILDQAKKSALRKDDLKVIENIKSELGAAPDAETLGRIFDKMGRYGGVEPAAVMGNDGLFLGRPLARYTAMSAFGPGRGLKTSTEVPSPLSDGDRQRFALVEKALLKRGFKKEIIGLVINEAIRQKADPLFVLAVVMAESNGQVNATSSVGARGLMQIMPATGKGLGVADPDNLYNAQTNVNAGVRFLKQLWNRFADISMAELAAINPFTRVDVKKVVAAYNAGPGAVKKYDGVPPYKETRNYVTKVIGYYSDLRALYSEAPAA